MKNVIKFLPVMAILLGSGLALATTQKMNDHNVYWDGSEWLPIPSGNYDCLGDDGQCTAFDDGNGNITDIRNGEYTPL